MKGPTSGTIVALAMRLLNTPSRPSRGFFCTISATLPLTCAAEKEVPLQTAVPSNSSWPDDVWNGLASNELTTSTPGAQTSTQLPKLLNGARFGVSFFGPSSWTAPTLIVQSSAAGYHLRVSWELPAAATTMGATALCPLRSPRAAPSRALNPMRL